MNRAWDQQMQKWYVQNRQTTGPPAQHHREISFNIMKNHNGKGKNSSLFFNLEGEHKRQISQMQQVKKPTQSLFTHLIHFISISQVAGCSKIPMCLMWQAPEPGTEAHQQMQLSQSCLSECSIFESQHLLLQLNPTAGEIDHYRLRTVTKLRQNLQHHISCKIFLPDMKAVAGNRILQPGLLEMKKAALFQIKG